MADPRQLQHDDYLRVGAGLYRVVDVAESQVLLEDCRTLEQRWVDTAVISRSAELVRSAPADQ